MTLTHLLGVGNARLDRCLRARATGLPLVHRKRIPATIRGALREREFLLDRIGSGDVPGTLAQPPLVEPVTVYERSPYNLREASLQLPRGVPGRSVPRPRDCSRRRSGFTSTSSTLSSWASRGKTSSSRRAPAPGRRSRSCCPSWPIWRATLERGRDAPFLTTRTNVTHGPRRAGGGRRTTGEQQARRVGQWDHHPERPHALRGIILYPLNALVEDQLRRLRRTLGVDRRSMTGWTRAVAATESSSGGIPARRPYRGSGSG